MNSCICNFPKDNIAEKKFSYWTEYIKKVNVRFFQVKKVLVPWHIHQSHITHKYCVVPYYPVLFEMERLRFSNTLHRSKKDAKC